MLSFPVHNQSPLRFSRRTGSEFPLCPKKDDARHLSETAGLAFNIKCLLFFSAFVIVTVCLRLTTFSVALAGNAFSHLKRQNISVYKGDNKITYGF
jgi:hypothetical protein